MDQIKKDEKKSSLADEDITNPMINQFHLDKKKDRQKMSGVKALPATFPSTRKRMYHSDPHEHTFVRDYHQTKQTWAAAP